MQMDMIDSLLGKCGVGNNLSLTSKYVLYNIINMYCWLSYNYLIILYPASLASAVSTLQFYKHDK